MGTDKKNLTGTSEPRPHRQSTQDACVWHAVAFINYTHLSDAACQLHLRTAVNGAHSHTRISPHLADPPRRVVGSGATEARACEVTAQRTHTHELMITHAVMF